MKAPAFHLIVHINPVQSDVALVAARSVSLRRLRCPVTVDASERLPVYVTPAWRANRVGHVEAFKRQSLKYGFPPKAFPMEASVVLTKAASACTSIVSLCAPTSKLICCTRRCDEELNVFRHTGAKSRRLNRRLIRARQSP